MSFTSGSVTATRYRLSGNKPFMFDERHLDRLKDHARPKIANASGVEVGWSAGEHYADLDFTLEKNVYPDHLLWDLWVQTDPLPADRLKAYYATELKALSANNPSGFPSAKQKREARETAREQLEQESRDGRYRKWNQIPCCWDLVRNELLVGTTSSAMLDRFEAMFSKTFGNDITQPDALAGACTLTHAGWLANQIGGRTTPVSASLSEFVKDITPDDGPCWAVSEGDLRFLGNEFAVWLWWNSDSNDTLRVSDGSSVVVMFSGGMKLDCPRGQSGNDTLNHDGPTRMLEAKAALVTGKLPRKIGLTFVTKDEQYATHLQVENWQITSAKLPRTPADLKSKRDAVIHRLQACRDLFETLDQLYLAFLSDRLSAAWPEDLNRIRRWISKVKETV